RSAMVRVALEDGVEQSACVRLSSEVFEVKSSELDLEADAIFAIGGERDGPLELLSGGRKLTIAQLELTERNDSAQMIGHELLDASERRDGCTAVLVMFLVDASDGHPVGDNRLGVRRCLSRGGEARDEASRIADAREEIAEMIRRVPI